jgi:hypothetical protein
MTMSEDDGFLSRWSRRKTAVRDGQPLRDSPPAPVPSMPVDAPAAGRPPRADGVVAPSAPREAAGPEIPAPPPGQGEGQAVTPPPPVPTLDDVAPLTPASDFRPFMRSGVDPSVRNAALKKMFVDPRFNVIDEMDIDIMDYNQLEPLPASMLRQMAQAHSLGLFRDEEKPPETPPPAAAPTDIPAEAPGTPAAEGDVPCEPTPTDEDPDLRLQPDDAAGCPGDCPGPGPLGGREH